VALTSHVLDGVQISPKARDTFERKDVGISLHDVDQRSDWPADDVVGCHIKFSPRKIRPGCGLLFKFLFKFFYHLSSLLNTSVKKSQQTACNFPTAPYPT